MEQYSYEMAIDRAKNHKVVHHYTTFVSLEKIINNKSLRLTRADLLNDVIENEKLNGLWKNKI